jgi:hypothetical protein
MFKLGSILECNDPSDFRLLELPDACQLYYSKISLGNVDVSWAGNGQRYSALAYCKQCSLTKYLIVPSIATVIVPKIEEFCKDHRHEAALDRKEDDGQ